MKCPRCQQENENGANFCLRCGTPLPSVAGGLASPSADLQAENEALRRALKECRTQQAAAAEILQVISGSSSDIRPVFEAIVASATRLCDAIDGTILRVDRDELVLVAHQGPISSFPVGPFSALTAGRPTSRAVLEARTIHIVDLQAEVDQYPEGSALARDHGFRTVLSVPLMRGAAAIGVIVIRRAEARAFGERQIELLRTFADQAVIAIENVRMFTELQANNRALTEAHAQVTESLEQQTATSEILRVIASSPTDVQPVFDTILSRATILLGGFVASITRRVGDDVHMAAFTSMGESLDATVRESYPVSIDSHNPHAVAIRRCEPHIIADADTQADIPEPVRRMARARGWRSNLSVPLQRAGAALGALGVSRRDAKGFTAEEVALLQTFADQAVIAIENVRLFTELQEKNQALTQAHAQVTEALEQQTATSEILRVISSSPTDTRPVFEGIARSGVRVCGALGCAVFVIDDDVIRVAATHGVKKERLERFRTQFPAPVSAEPEFTRVIREGLFHLADIANNPEATAEQIEYARLAGYRTRLMVPMLRGADVLGVIAVTREDTSPFSDQQVELLKTFADQAVIAIENVRLFNELQARTQELTRSVGQLTALGEVGRAVSSTLDLKTVLSTIVSRAIQLSGTDGGSVYEYDEATEEFSLRASRDLPEAYVEQVRDARPRKGEGAVGRVALTREPVQIVDISDPAAYESRVRNMLLQIGLRALLAVPLIAEDRLVGALIVMRKRTGTFAAEEVALLQTFATQSALAIQNARLFREIADKSHQLEVASQHKSEFLANMSHELRTPLNAVIGFSEVLSEGMFGQLNEKQEEYARDIYSSGQHLLSLINDILDLSKIEAGRMELEVSDFHLPAALDNALTLVRERAGRRGIALGLTVDERLGQIRADERKIRQVVLNLLSNAIKFTPEGGRIDVTARLSDRLVEVSVTDTGIGIAPEDQEAVFDEFRQVGRSDKKAEGTGLGLTLCRKFIELHGGKIWVKSELGKGSTFTFTIPLQPGQ